jgi:LPS-assembly protein
MHLAIAAAVAAALSSADVHADDCPQPMRVQSPTSRSADAPASSTIDADEPIEFEAGKLEAIRDGVMKLEDNVVITQGERRIEAPSASYDTSTQGFKVDEGVTYTDPNLVVRGKGAVVDPQTGATFEGAEFELPARSARGAANRINAKKEGKLELDGVRYTTCPVGNEDWMLRASDIDIDQRAGLGIGRGVRLDFKGVPILYTPFISFPVGIERKSGFLFPTIGTSSRSGYSLSTPWYWNIAPNYDATFTPTYYSKRGARLDTEFRYLTDLGRGIVFADYLPDDDEAGGIERSLLRYTNKSDFTDRLRLDIDAANASDSQWFEDFGLGPEGTSITYLNRSADLRYLDDHWLAVLRAQNFQTIDDIGIPDPADRPHTILPQLAVRAAFPDTPYGLFAGVDFELSDFQHNYEFGLDGTPIATGWRVDVAPEIRMPLRGAGIYLEPAASWRYTAYQLDDLEPGADDTPTRALPLLSVEGGLVFERETGSRNQRLLTLEPRFMYLYVPFRDQTELPVFDTGAADLNVVQLFRTNRYVGADRLSDANQVSIGFTSRLLDSRSGEQFISGTIGQAYYFHRPRVGLPGEVIDDTEFSDLVAELDLRAYADWNISMGLQWDPGDTRSEKGDVRLQYKPDYDRVANVGYRFRRDSLEQVDGSVAWPIGTDWSAYARVVYSLQEKTTLDQFAGLEYRSCCWRVRVVARRNVSDRTGNRDTSILLQLELNGLSSVGVGADAFLERTIQGYSPGPPERP